MSGDNWTVIYYETEEGISVEEEFESFGPKVFARILRTANLLEEFGLELGGEYVRHVRGKIWELRVSRYRVLYFTFTGRQFVLLRAFMKKTRETPERELLTAKHRMDDYIDRMAVFSTDTGRGHSM